MVELVELDRRETRNAGFIAAWRECIVLLPGLESLSLVEQRGGPPHREPAALPSRMKQGMPGLQCVRSGAYAIPLSNSGGSDGRRARRFALRPGSIAGVRRRQGRNLLTPTAVAGVRRRRRAELRSVRTISRPVSTV